MSELISSFSDMITSLSSTLTSSVTGEKSTQDDLTLLTTFYQAYQECKSAHEVSVLVANHSKYLKWLLSNTRLTPSQSCEVLGRSLICKALGNDVSFAAIHAIQLAQSSQCWRHKRMAYLACCELMDEHSDMAILMVSTIQQDLRSKHVPTVCVALSTAAAIISSELLPSIDAVVSEKFNHQASLVRQRAVLCLAAFIRKNMEIIPSKLPYLKATLMDKDPSVMAASLQAIDSLPPEHIFSSDSLCKPLHFILSQFLNGNAPAKFIKKGVCGSHILVRLIRVLGKLDSSKSDWNQKLILLMLTVMDKYECVLSAPAVMVMKESCILLLRLSSDSKHSARVSGYARQLLASDAVNYHYTSLAIFSELIKRDKRQITSHQDLIVSSLASKDSAIAKKAILLIIELTNAQNVQSVFELYSETCHSTSSTLKYGVNILTSCCLRDVSIEWFAQKLLMLLTVAQKNFSNDSAQSQQSVLGCVLTYVSVESVEDSALELYNCLVTLTKQAETCSLDVFTTMLWLTFKHESVFNKSESSILPLIKSACCRSTKPYSNVKTFLSAIRSSMLAGTTSIKDSDVESLGQLVEASTDKASCYIYLRDIKDMLSGATEVEFSTETVTMDSLCSQLQRYKTDKISSKLCRVYNTDSANAEEKMLKFTTESDSRISTALFDTSTQIGKAKEVWTAKGRKDSTENHVPESSDVDDVSAPVEFRVEDGDDSKTKLASHIFSSI